MKYAPLPGASAPASRIALGTAWFGTAIPEDQAFALMDAYAAHGGNFLDTAHMYANWVSGGAGKSETTIAKWLRRAGTIRPLIATKGADKGMNRAGIRAQLAQSFERLGLASVDFYWLHVDDVSAPAGEVIEWMNELVKEGSFTAFGCSNWSIARIAQAQQYAAAHGLKGFAASQISWSLARAKADLTRGGNQIFMDDATLAYHRAAGLPIVAYSSQAGGFFAGNYDPQKPTPGVTPNAGIVKLFGTPENYARMARVNALAKARGVSPNQVALAYLLHHSFPSFAIAGANTVERMADSCAAADVTLTADEVQDLERGG